MRLWAGLAVLLTCAVFWFATRDRGAARARESDAAPPAPGLPANASQPDADVLRAKGVVLYGDAPAPGAHVVLIEAPGFWAGKLPAGRTLAEARTDATGRFSLPAVPGRCVVLEATWEGAAPARRLVRPGDAEFRIELAAIAREPEDPYRATGAVEGTVRDARGLPVARATVRVLLFNRTLEATADGAGRYRIDGMPAIQLQRCDVTAPGNVPQLCAPLPLAPVPEGGVLAFDPVVLDGVPLAGQVATSSGAVAASAGVALERVEETRAFRIGVATADARGSFRFAGLVPGRYLVHVHPEGHMDSNVRAEPGLRDRTLLAIDRVAPSPVTLVLPETGTVIGICDPRQAGEPGTLRIESFHYATLVDERGELHFENVPAAARGDLWLGRTHAGPFAIPAGGSVAVPVTVEPRAVFMGVVEDPVGQPIAGATVRAGDEGEPAWQMRLRAVSDGAGRYRLELAEKDVAARWALIATCPGFAAATARGLAQPERGAAVETRLRLDAGTRLEGTVVDEGGRPAPGTVVSASTEPEAQAMWNLPELGTVLDSGPYRETSRTRTDEKGRFAIDGLAPGAYWLKATVEGAASETTEVEVGGGGVGGHRLVLVPRGLTICGVVVDERDRRVRHALVEIELPDYTEGSAETTDEHGRFRLWDIPHGRHDVRVAPAWTAAANGTPGFEPCVVRGIEAGAQELTIRVGPGRILSGRVLSPEGDAVPEALVLVLPPPDDDPPMHERYTPNAITGRDGRFELRGVEGGTLEIGVFAPGYLHGGFAASGGGEPVTFRLSPGGTVEGVVLDADGQGKPAHGVSLELEAPSRPEQIVPWRRRNKYGPRFFARTGEDGRFRIVGLPDGEYEVDAGGSIPLRRVRSGEKGVVLREEKLLAVAGIVLDELGQPATDDGTGSRLKISAYSGERIVGYIPVESDGSFRFKDAPPGPVRLSVNGFPRFEEIRMEVAAGSEGVRVQLRPGKFRDHRSDGD